MLGGSGFAATAHSQIVHTPSSSSHAMEEEGEYSSPIISLSTGSNDDDEIETTTMANHRTLIESRSFGCQANQHTLFFTLYTDTHSTDDNSWQFSYASYGYGKETGNSGKFIDEGRVGMGNLGNGAVLTQAICVDKATTVGGVVESCYDLELRDAIGDGLTAPHSGGGGLAGGFSLKIDGDVVAEHRGKACLSDDDEEWNECAIESGFALCGLRVCTVSDGGKATVSNLSGSHCTFAQPQCDAESQFKSSSSSVSVNVDTDSFSQELSWEVRRSSKFGSKKRNQATQNELLLAGGMPVYEKDSDKIILGQLGVGVPLADNESYETVACLPDVDDPSQTCFDFRAHDAYGDGMGCGADGTLSIVLETPGTIALGEATREMVTLTQLDEDIAKQHHVEGKKQLACMNKEKLSKWSYCAVRVCANGDVIGLEGNQCDFGQGEDLIDERYVGVDPLEELEMKPQNQNANEWSPLPVDDQEEEEEKVVVIDLEDIPLNIIDTYDSVEPQNEEIDVDEMSWAEYYEYYEPGFKDVGIYAVSGNIGDGISNTIAAAMSESSEKGDVRFDLDFTKPSNNNQEKPNEKQQQKGQNRPRPNRPNKQQGQKGLKPSKGKQDDQDNIRPFSQRKQTLDLKPFSTNLLNVRFPYPLKGARPSQLSSVVADYLQSYFDDFVNDNYDVPWPSNFKLDCTKFKKKIGPELRWVLECDGEVDFQLPSSVSMPTKKAVADVIRDAFSGRGEEKFLELMYSTQNVNKFQTKMDKLLNREDKKKQKKKQQKKKKQRQERLNRKKKDKQEKIEAMKEMKMDIVGAKQQQQQGDVNIMGYVSGTQYMNKLSDSDKGYQILNGDIFITVNEGSGGPRVATGGGKGNNTQQRPRRKRNNQEEDGGKRMLRRSVQKLTDLT